MPWDKAHWPSPGASAGGPRAGWIGTLSFFFSNYQLRGHSSRRAVYTYYPATEVLFREGPGKHKVALSSSPVPASFPLLCCIFLTNPVVKTVTQSRAGSLLTSLFCGWESMLAIQTPDKGADWERPAWSILNWRAQCPLSAEVPALSGCLRSSEVIVMLGEGCKSE